MKKAPNEVDRHVGARVRMRRNMIAMSQEKLGEALGLTFQQVQKYEKGSNRISASRLQQIGNVLGVTIDYFYDGLSAEAGGPPSGFAEGSSPAYEADMFTAEGLKLLRAFGAISDPRIRRRIVELVHALAAAPEPIKETERSD